MSPVLLNPYAFNSSSPPPVLDGLLGWYSPQFETTETADGATPTLTDLSGNGNHGTPSSGPTLAYTGGPDGGPMLACAHGQGWTLPSDMFTGVTAMEIFAVIKSLGPMRGPWLMGGAGQDQYYPYSTENGSVYSDFGSTSRPGFSVASKPPVGNWRRLNCYSAPGDWKFFLDEEQMHSMGSNTVSPPTAPYLGSITNVGNPSGVQFGGIAIYGWSDGTVMDAGERATTRAWQVEVPSGGMP